MKSILLFLVLATSLAAQTYSGFGDGGFVWGKGYGTLSSQADLQSALNAKQATLVSATNIKTVNGGTLLGSGDLTVSGAVAWGGITGTLSSQTDLQTALNAKAATASLATVATTGAYSDLTGKPTLFDGAYASLTGKPTLGTAAATNSTAYEVPLTFSTGLTRTVNTVTVNTSQNIATLSNLTSNGFVKTGGAAGTLSIDTVAYAPLASPTFTGTVVLPASTSLTTPVIGVATGTSLAATGAVTSSGTAGIGYATGAGGTVTQGTNRTTGVTLNKTCGAITLISAAGSTTFASFTVTNSTVAATDVPVVVQKSGTDLYEIHVTAVAAGSFRISYKTTGGTTTEQPVFTYVVLKGASA